MGFREDAVSNMRRFVSEGTPYVFGGGRPLSMGRCLSGTDCSGSVVAACEAARPGCTGGASYTGDMLGRFTGTGLWRWHPAGDGYAARPGDVWLYVAEAGGIGHTAMCTGGGLLAELYPPQAREVAFYDYPWTGTLEWVGDGEGGGQPPAPQGSWRVASGPLNVRAAPSLAAEVVASYAVGETVALDPEMVVADGHVWGRYTGAQSGEARYVAVCPWEPPADAYLVKA